MKTETVCLHPLGTFNHLLELEFEFTRFMLKVSVVFRINKSSIGFKHKTIHLCTNSGTESSSVLHNKALTKQKKNRDWTEALESLQLH